MRLRNPHRGWCLLVMLMMLHSIIYCNIRSLGREAKGWTTILRHILYFTLAQLARSCVGGLFMSRIMTMAMINLNMRMSTTMKKMMIVKMSRRGGRLVADHRSRLAWVAAWYTPAHFAWSSRWWSWWWFYNTQLRSSFEWQQGAEKERPLWPQHTPLGATRASSFIS